MASNAGVTPSTCTSKVVPFWGVVLSRGVLPELTAQAVTVTAITLMSTTARPDPITKTLYLPALGLSPACPLNGTQWALAFQRGLPRI